ncbi:MAG: RagB/SusD family nutrient uptake outer membrane protein [Chitinophagaceae bacterium]|nr:RagB/SusD family nutrient uptake outer membrane protein [Chitinophagaceae bacterium]
MKKILYTSLAFLLMATAGCDKYLDRKPLDASSASNFLTNQAEMEQGLTGVYASAMWVFPNNTPLLFAVEASTDHAIKRGGNAEDLAAMGEAGPFLINNALVNTCWSSAYRLIQRANQQLKGMEENGKNNVSAQVFGRIKAETLVLRAWAYFHLMYMFGDVPYYKVPPTVDEVLAAEKTPRATIVADLYKDLDEAVAGFDAANAAAILGNGRVNKGVALGLKAKLALLIGDFRTAATATKAVIDGGQYGLNPSYPNLFMLNGQTANANREILFNQTYPTDQLNPQSWLVVLSIPRQVTNSQSSHFPSQALVDQFEGKDGKRIDQSAVYDPANPRANRDSRLKWTVVMQDDTVAYRNNTNIAPYVNPVERTIYNIYSNVRRRFNWTTSRYDNVSGNNDWIGAQAAGIQWQVSATGNIGGVGYAWRKYIDSTQYSWETKTGYILMRYADILLMYAESKIELNEIDATVVNAINAVRRRSGQPDIAASSQAEMRTIVRRERAVEFGGEGHRLFDLRRWDIYGVANSGPVVGAALDPAVPPATPTFDANNIPNYGASINQRIRFRNQTRNNTNPRYKLWPIPQFEIDVNPKLTQNPGWQ